MKQNKFLLGLGLVLAISMTSLAVRAETVQLNYVENTNVKNKDVYTGVSWDTMTGVSTTDGGTEGAQVINTVTMDKSIAKNVELVHWSYNTGVKWQKATLNKLASDYEEKNPGYHVLAGINGDFFNMSDPIYAFGDQVANGNVYGTHPSWLSNFMSLGVDYYNNPIISTKGYADSNTYYTLYVYDQTGTYLTNSYMVAAMNQEPTENGISLYMYNNQGPMSSSTGVKHFTIGNTTGDDENFIKYPSGETQYALTYGQGIVTSSQEGVTLVESQFGIASSNQELNALLTSGRKVKIQKDLTGEYANVLSLGGAGGVSMRDGSILTFANMNAASSKSERHPRTAIGIKEDGSIIMAAIDGRDQSNGRYGMNLREVANFLSTKGAKDVVCFDGGGSTTLIIPNEDGTGWQTTNQCSDGAQRQVVDAWLLVVPDVSSQASIENLENSKISLTVNPILKDDSLELQEMSVVVNGEKQALSSSGKQTKELQLIESKKNFIYFEYKIKNKNTNEAYTISSHVIVKDLAQKGEVVISPPRDFTLTATRSGGITIFTLTTEGSIKPSIVRLFVDGVKKDTGVGTFSVASITAGTVHEITIQYDYVDENKVSQKAVEYPCTFYYYYENGMSVMFPKVSNVASGLLGESAINKLTNQ